MENTAIATKADSNYAYYDGSTEVRVLDGTEYAFPGGFPGKITERQWLRRSKKECKNPTCNRVICVSKSKAKTRQYCTIKCRAAYQGVVFNQNHYGPDFQPTPHSIADKKWRESNRARSRAALDSAAARRAGKYSLKSACEDCGSNRDLTGHHWSYAPEHKHVVETLCRQCHRPADIVRAALEKLGIEGGQLLGLMSRFRAGTADYEDLKLVKNAYEKAREEVVVS